MTKIKKYFKYSLRQCRKDVEIHEANGLAAALQADKTKKSFWQKVNNTNRSPSIPTLLGGANGGSEIVKMWKDYFKGILNSENSDNGSAESVEHSIDCKENYLGLKMPMCSFVSLASLLQKLPLNKSPGPDCISEEHLLYADESLRSFLSELFNMCIVHGYIPNSCLNTTIVPIYKTKNGNMSDTSNYRLVAVATVLSKLLEHFILSHISPLLDTTDNQFGFKAGRSTDQCTFSLKQTASNFVIHGSSVHAVFFDASKAFDRVLHMKLFGTLIQRKAPMSFVRLLKHWYKEQKMQIKWGKQFSEAFHVSNGVRQGGVLSPYLFAVYLDDLSTEINNIKAGCYIGEVLLNHLIFADNICVLCPSVRLLQRILDVCQASAE